jgi:hypothetical protein
VLLVVFGFAAGPVATKIQEGRARAREAYITKTALPELRHLAHSFAEFVDTGRADTFHYIVESEMCQNNGELLAKIPIPPLSLWYYLAGYFEDRAWRHSLRLGDLRQTMMEFQHLVGSYNNLCVTPVFERLPKDLEPALTPKIKGKLNLFQQRFTSFLKEYETFVKRLEQADSSCRGLPRSFVWPKPLT